MSEIKTYILLDDLDVSAPIYQRATKDQRVKLQKIPYFRPFLQVTFVDKDGVNRTIRYKENSNTVYQDEQIKSGIPANDRFTTQERKAPMFINGTLTTNKPMLQKFLEVSPQMDGFEGICNDPAVRPSFKEYKQTDDISSRNADFIKRVEVGVKIKNLNLEEAQEMLIRINGSWFKVPTDLKEAQNQLVDFMDNTDDAGLDEMLKDEDSLTADEKATVLIGNLINADIISFNAVEGMVAKKKGKDWIKIKDIPGDLSHAEKEKYFADFLTTKAGVPLAEDLAKDLEKTKPKTK